MNTLAFSDVVLLLWSPGLLWIRWFWPVAITIIITCLSLRPTLCLLVLSIPRGESSCSLTFHLCCIILIQSLIMMMMMMMMITSWAAGDWWRRPGMFKHLRFCLNGFPLWCNDLILFCCLIFCWWQVDNRPSWSAILFFVCNFWATATRGFPLVKQIVIMMKIKTI